MSKGLYVDEILNKKPSLEKRDPNAKWYLVQTQSNCEAKAIKNIAIRLTLSGVEDKVEQMFFPVIERKIRSLGKKEKIKKEKMYSNYVFILANMDETVYEAIKHSDKVTGFVQGAKAVIDGLPKPISPLEVKNVIERLSEFEEGKISLDRFKAGDAVRIISGAFVDTVGNINSIDGNRVVVNVTVFGRETPLNLTLKDIEPLKD